MTMLEYKFSSYDRIYTTMEKLDNAIKFEKWRVTYYRIHHNQHCYRSSKYELDCLIKYKTYKLNGGLKQMELDLGI